MVAKKKRSTAKKPRTNKARAAKTQIVTTVETEQPGVVSRQDIAEIVKEELCDEVHAEIRAEEKKLNALTKARDESWESVKNTIDDALEKGFNKRKLLNHFREMGMSSIFKVQSAELYQRNQYARTRQQMELAFWISIRIGTDAKPEQKRRLRRVDGSYLELQNHSWGRDYDHTIVTYPVAPEYVPKKILDAVDAHTPFDTAVDEQNEVIQKLKEQLREIQHVTRSMRTKIMRAELNETVDGQAILAGIESMKKGIRDKVTLALTDGEGS